MEWGGGTQDTVSEDEDFPDQVQGDAGAGVVMDSIFMNENEEVTSRIQVEEDHDTTDGVNASIGTLRK